MMRIIKKYLNLLKFYRNYYTKSLIIDNYPVEAYIEPTASCFLQCPACPTGARLDGRHKGSLELDQFKSMIDEFGEYLFNLYMYNWGEPTLHKDFPEMIKYASDKGIRVFSSTNLSVKMDDDYINRLVNSGLYSLTVSIDGLTQGTYSKYRVGGDLEIVLSNLERLHEAKINYRSRMKIIWQFLVFQHNEHEIDLLKKVYKELGADLLYVAPGIIPKNSDINPSTNPLYPPQTQLKSHPSGTCSQLYGCVTINPSGSVSPCCAIPFESLDYSVYDGDVRKSMNSDRFIKAREFFKQGNMPLFGDDEVNGMAFGLIPGILACKQCPATIIHDAVFHNTSVIIQKKNHVVFYITNQLKRFRR